MAAQINMRRRKLPTDIIKRSAGLIAGAAGDYFSDAMPTTSSTLSEAKSTITDFNTAFRNTAQKVMPHVKSIKSQSGMRSVFKWFMGEEASYDSFGSQDDNTRNLDFDTPTDASDDQVDESQPSELETQTDKVAMSVLGSNEHMLEGQTQLTANVVSSISNQSGVISTGFDSVNSKLDSILEVLTKNTSAMVTAMAGSSSSSNEDTSISDMIGNGRFNLRSYKKLLSNNINSSPLGLVKAFLPLLDPNTMKTMITPETITNGIFSLIVDSKAPKLKKNLKALDDSVNDVIMQSLIRLGEDKSNPIARLFGIDSSRKNFENNSRSKVSLGAVPFDGVTREYITQAIPGYLRKILVQLGGEDLVYNATSRSFVRKASIQKEFAKQTASTGNLGAASTRVQKAFGGDRLADYAYDKMLNDLGYAQGETDFSRKQSKARVTLDTFSNPENAYKYLEKLVKPKDNIERQRLHQVAENISDPRVLSEIGINLAKNNVTTNARATNWLKNADAYGIDVSQLKSNRVISNKSIDEEYGRSDSVISAGEGGSLTGINYTNQAVFEIYRLLSRGINVYKVGEDSSHDHPYPKYNGRYLKAPAKYKPKDIIDRIASNKSLADASELNATSDEENPLMNHEGENLNAGDRLSRWGDKRGGDLLRALFSGSPKQVQEAFNAGINDIIGVANGEVKKGISKINNSFGNVTGYLKHKMFGAAYEYQNDEGKTVHVKENDKGGMFGFARDYLKEKFDNAKKSAGKWFQSVSSYFDYDSLGKDKDNPNKDKNIKSLRKKIIATSVGAFAGAGILGNPIGVIVGSLAANALSTADIGDKIKGLLIGRDEKTGKAKGLITKAFDKVVDPIRYQFQKTGHTLAKVLKNKIIGPLSDIGYAVKERIVNKADSTFGKVFKFIGKALMLPFKAIGNLIKTPFQIAGGMIRGAANLAGSVIGGGEEGIAKIIGHGVKHTYTDENGNEVTESVNKTIDRRRKARKAAAKEDKFDDYKTWKGKEDERRAAWMKKWHEYTAEDADIQKDIKDKEESIDKNVDTITKLGSKEGSIFTHDKGIHDRLDTIINLITGNKRDAAKSIDEVNKDKKHKDASAKSTKPAGAAIKKPTDQPARSPIDYSNSLISRSTTKEQWKAQHRANRIIGVTSETVVDGKTGAKLTALQADQKAHTSGANTAMDNNFANAIVGAATFAGARGGFDNNDVRDLGTIAKEASKRNSNAEVEQRKYQSILNNNKRKGDEDNKKKKSFLQKLIDFFKGKGGILEILKKLLLGAGILTSILGIAKLIKDGNDLINSTIGNIKDTISTMLRDFDFTKDNDKDPATSNDSTTRGINAALAPGDTKVKHWTDTANPFAPLYHRDNDAAGNPIVNQDATRRKQVNLIWKPLAGASTKQIRNKYLNDTVGGMQQSEETAAGAKLSENQRKYDIANKRQNLFNAFKEAKGPENTVAKTREGKENVTSSDILVDATSSEVAKIRDRSMTEDEYKALRRKQRTLHPEGKATGATINTHGKKSTAKNEPAAGAAIDAMKNKKVQDTESDYTTARHADELVEERNKSNAAGEGNIVLNAGQAAVDNALSSYVSAGISTGVGKATGGLTTAIATKITGSKKKGKEYGEMAERAGTTFTSYGLTVNGITTGIKNKFVEPDKQKAGVTETVVGWIKKLFDFLASHLRAVGALKSGITKITSKLSSLYEKTIGKVTNAVARKIAGAMAKIAGKESADDFITAASGGMNIAAGAVAGALNGLSSSEHLFHVQPGQADARMKWISTLMQSLFSAMEIAPAAGTLVSIFRLIDDTLIKGIVGKSLEEYLAEIIYVATGGKDSTLKEKQSKMKAKKEEYESTFGASMNDSSWNDLVNSGGLIDKIWRGNVKKDKNGDIDIKATFDEAGARKNGGLSSIIFGNEQEYMKDEYGNIIRNEEGGAVKAVDAHGNKIKKNAKIGDKVSATINGVKQFFTGGDEYKTNSKGQAMVDSNGNYIVKRKRQNILQKGATFFAGGKVTKNLTRAEAEKNVQDKYGFSGPTMINGLPAYYSSVWHRYYSQSDYNAYVDEEQRNGTKTVNEKNIFGKAADAATTVGKGAKKAAGTVKDTAKKAAGTVKDTVINAGKGIKDNAIKLADNVKNSKVGKAFGEIGDKFTGWLSDVANFSKAIIAEKKDVMDQLNNPDSTGSALWTIKTKVDENHPLAGLFKATLVGARLSMVPTMIMRRIGIGIKDVAVKAFNKAAKFGSDVGKSVSKVNDARNKGDIAGMFSAAEVTNDDSVVSPFGTVIAGAGAVANTPIAGTIWIGKQIANGAKKLFNGLAEWNSTMSGPAKLMNDSMLKGDIPGMFSAKVDSDNPVISTLGDVSVKANAVIRTPIAGAVWLGKNVVKGVKKTAAGIATFASDMSSVNSSIKDAGLKGDIKGMFSAAKLDSDNPVTSNFGTIIAKVGAAAWTPLAGTIWAGKTLWHALKAPIKAAADAGSNFGDNLSSVSEAAKNGEVSQVLSGIKYQGNEDNPLNGLMKGIFTGARFTYAPSALIHWTGKKIAKFFTAAVDSAKSDHSTFEDGLDKLKDYASDGKTSKIMAASISTTKGDPLSLIYKAGFGMSQIFYGMSSIAHKIGDSFKGAIETLKDKLGGWLKKIGESIKGGINTFWDWLKGDEDGIELETDSGGPKGTHYVSSMYSAPMGGPVESNGSPLSKPYTISSGFGNRTSPYPGMHKGVDLVPVGGKADVSSQVDGTISYVKRDVSNSDKAKRGANGKWEYNGTNSGGNEVWIDTPSGYRIKNMHLAAGSIPTDLHRGSTVKAGQTLGQVGSTGWSTGNHLHYQVEKDGKPINPQSTILPSGSKVTMYSAPMGGPDPESWLNVVREVKRKYAASGVKYHADNSHNFNITVGGVTKSVRPDCSGFVSACLQYYGVMNSTLTSYGFTDRNNATMKKTGFTSMTWPGWQKLQPGDIIAKDGHVEIFAGIQQGSNQHMVYNAGSTSAIQNPGQSYSSKSSYTTVWRPGPAGSAAVNVNAASDSSSSSSSDSSSSSEPQDIGTLLSNLATNYLSELTGGLIPKVDTSNGSDSTLSVPSSTSGSSSTDSGDGSYTPSDSTIAAIEKQDLGKFTKPSVAQMNAWINKVAPKNSTFRGHGDVFLKASEVSGLDPRYILAHAAVESAWGTSHIARTKNNYFGIGAFNSSPYASAYSFGSGLANGISGGAKWISDHYYNGKYGQKNLHDMLGKGHVYAVLNNGKPNWGWADSIAKIMKNGPANSTGGSTVDPDIPFAYSKISNEKLFDQSQKESYNPIAVGGSTSEATIAKVAYKKPKTKTKSTPTTKSTTKITPVHRKISSINVDDQLQTIEPSSATNVKVSNGNLNEIITVLQGLLYQLESINDNTATTADNTKDSLTYLNELNSKTLSNSEVNAEYQKLTNKLRQKQGSKRNTQTSGSAKTVAALAAP